MAQEKARETHKPKAPEIPTHNMHGPLSREAEEEQGEDESCRANAASLSEWIKAGEEKRKQKEHQKMMRKIHRKTNQEAKKKGVTNELHEVNQQDDDQKVPEVPEATEDMVRTRRRGRTMKSRFMGCQGGQGCECSDDAGIHPTGDMPDWSAGRALKGGEKMKQTLNALLTIAPEGLSVVADGEWE